MKMEEVCELYLYVQFPRNQGVAVLMYCGCCFEMVGYTLYTRLLETSSNDNDNDNDNNNGGPSKFRFLYSSEPYVFRLLQFTPILFLKVI